MVSDLVDLFHYQRHRKWAFLHPLGRVPWFFKNSGCGQQGMNSYHFIALGILNLSFLFGFWALFTSGWIRRFSNDPTPFSGSDIGHEVHQDPVESYIQIPIPSTKKNFSHWPQQKGRKLVEQKVAVTWPQGRPSVCNYHHLISMHHMIKT